MSGTVNLFVKKFAEKADFNQYWYSPATIEALELTAVATKAAFLSTPSVYFSLPKGDLRSNSWVLDFDEQWATDAHFLKYDFNEPENIPEHLHHAFDCVVVDPPFITEAVWRKYAQTIKLLLSPQGKVIISTVLENRTFLHELLAVEPCKFKPSIPHLVYQYHFFLNYASEHLCFSNPELPEDD